FIFPAGILMVGTDPVAMDTIELEKIEAKRLAERAPSVWSRDPKSLTENGGEFYEDATKNLYYRQPHHIAAAGERGLGVSDGKAIVYRVLGAGGSQNANRREVQITGLTATGPCCFLTTRAAADNRRGHGGLRGNLFGKPGLRDG